MRRLGVIGAVGVFAAATTGCNNAGQGALTGAGLGAAGGAIIGSLYGHAGTGAAIGAVSGGLTGGVIGDQNARRSAYGYSSGPVYGSYQSGPVYGGGTTYYVPSPDVHVYYEYSRPHHSYYHHHHHHHRSHRYWR